MSQPAASDRAARSPSEPPSACMERSSDSSRPSKPIWPRITFFTPPAEIVMAWVGSIASNNRWPVIAQGNAVLARASALAKG